MSSQTTPSRSQPSPAVAALPKTMRAWIYTRRGLPLSILQLSDRTLVPSLASDNSVLVKVSHVALQPGSVILMRLVPMLFRGGRSEDGCIAEADFSGVVVAIGRNAASPIASSSNSSSSEAIDQADQPDRNNKTDSHTFSPSDPVFGSLPVPQHIRGTGALAEYVCLAPTSLTAKPSTLDFPSAAGLGVSGTTALDLFDAANLYPGLKILINAPCGGIGSYLTQLARHALGPEGTIVGVCSGAKWKTARALGVDVCLEYKSDPPPGSESGRGGKGGLMASLKKNYGVRWNGDSSCGFDRVIDCYGSQELWRACPAFLKSGKESAYVTVGPKLQSYSVFGVARWLLTTLVNVLLPPWLGGVDRRYRHVAATVTKEILERLKGLCEEEILKTVVGGEWGMEDALEAYEELVGGHAQGKLVIKVQDV